MKDLNHKQTLGVAITTAIICFLFMFSSFFGEFLYSKVSPPALPIRDTVTVTVSDTVYFDMCSSCVHFDNCIKCQKYEQELVKKGLINP
jgi:hypothetical protein